MGREVVNLAIITPGVERGSCYGTAFPQHTRGVRHHPLVLSRLVWCVTVTRLPCAASLSPRRRPLPPPRILRFRRAGADSRCIYVSIRAGDHFSGVAERSFGPRGRFLRGLEVRRMSFPSHLPSQPMRRLGHEEGLEPRLDARVAALEGSTHLSLEKGKSGLRHPHADNPRGYRRTPV